MGISLQANLPTPMQIYIQHNGQQLGPFTEAEFRAKLASGEISAQDHVWYQGMANWMPVAQSPLVGPVVPGALPIPNATYPVAPTAKYAVPALVCGCLALICSIFTSIPAIILGHMSLSEIKKNPGMQGRGMALAGMILGYVLTAFSILYFAVVGISILIALGNQVKNEEDKAKTEMVTPSTSNESTNSPDQNATAPATTTTPATSSDQSTTNSDTPTTNSPDQNTMSTTPAAETPSTTPSDSSTTNAAPATVTP